MTWVPYALETFTENLGADTTSNASGQVLTANGSANTMGSWAQLGTSGATGNTTSEYFGFLFSWRIVSTADFLIDIGIGAGGAQQVIVNNIYVPNRIASGIVNQSVYFPVYIPNGASVWARCQASTGSSTIFAMLTGITGGAAMFPPYRGAFLIGAQAGSSRATNFDPGSVAGTQSSWSQLAADTTWSSVSRVINAIMPMWGSNGTTTKVAAGILSDIGIGAAASEQPIIINLQKRLSSNAVTSLIDGPFPCSIPAGSRTSLRFRPGTGISATLAQRDLDVGLMAFVQ